MNILMISPTPFFSDRGCHIRIYQEAKALISTGHKVTIATYHIGDTIPGVPVERIINIPWYKKISAGPSLHKFYLDLLLLIKCMMLCFKARPDILHAHLHEGVFIGKILSWLFRVPLVFDVQGRLTGELKAHRFIRENSLHYKAMSALEKMSYKLADAFVVNSQFMADHLEETFTVKSGSIVVVPDADSNSYYPPSQTKEALKKSLGIPLDKHVVIYLGLLTDYQGIDGLISVIRSLAQQRTDIHFLIMGYPNVEKYKQLCQQLGIADCVTFTGRVRYRRVYEYLSLGDVAVSPKFIESGEGNGKIYNYLSAGLPIVLFDYPVNREILGDYGVYAQPDDLPSFADCIARVIDDPGLRKKIKSGLAQLCKAISWEESSSTLSTMYTSLKKSTPLNDPAPERIRFTSGPVKVEQIMGPEGRTSNGKH